MKAIIGLFLLVLGGAHADEIFIRANQVGYQMNEAKLAIAFSKAPLPPGFTLVAENNEGEVFFQGKTKSVTNATWGQFAYHAGLDFSSVHTPGKFVLKIGESKSLPLRIGNAPYGELSAELLEFMREQRCGYNPWLGTNCHQLDGRTAYGPQTNGTPMDATGGWHDAGDLLKYLLTSGNATAQMLLAYELSPKPRYSEKLRRMVVPPQLADEFTALGQPGTNGIPDLLDEARWGLDWMLKLHPAPDQLYHQVADDRDHAGWRLPQEDPVDYGWGKGGAARRVFRRWPAARFETIQKCVHRRRKSRGPLRRRDGARVSNLERRSTAKRFCRALSASRQGSL